MRLQSKKSGVAKPKALEEDKKEKLSAALRANLQKRKLFQKKINNKE
mgnify:CR=1 FL=1